MFDAKLSVEDQAKIARVSGSFLAGLCRGTATALKGTGFQFFIPALWTSSC